MVAEGHLCWDNNTLNLSTEYKQMSFNSFKNIVTYKLFNYKS